MTRQMPAMIWRAVAIAIAVAAIVDPVFTVERQRATPLVLVDLTDGAGADVLDRLRSSESNVVTRQAREEQVPCEPGERCVIIADGSRHARVAEDIGAAIALVTVGRDHPNVSLESATATSSHHRGAAGVVSVSMRGDGITGKTVTIRILDQSAVIGAASVEWEKGEPIAIDVPWWPIAEGARALRVEATVDGGDAVDFDNAIDLPVTIGNRAVNVLVFDARPSWSSTFVRRALEDDPRFAVDHRARVAPAITTGTAAARLEARILEDTPVVIAGAPDALTAAEVELLDRYVRVRGGTLILLPEREPAGTVAQLFPGDWNEQLRAEPEPAGALRASELLRPRTKVFGAVEISPLITATPIGHGHVIVSGAMDAWRYRDLDAAAFDRFWASLAAESALSGQRLRVEFGDGVASPGRRMPFTVRYRSLTPMDALEANAVARCDRAQTIRLWPAGSLGVFHGEIPIANVPSCSLEVTINDVIASAAVAVAERPKRGASATLAALAAAARASGGVVTDKDNLDAVRALNSSSPRSEAEPMHPMRSVWWLAPFVGCLSAEWWLRRRKGMR